MLDINEIRKRAQQASERAADSMKKARFYLKYQRIYNAPKLCYNQLISFIIAAVGTGFGGCAQAGVLEWI